MVTALFCDLVDSTALGERLDPESLQLVLGRYFGAARQTVERHGGRVEKFIGDAVAAVFGVPVAHEDDALRAARAALDLQDAVAGVNTGLTHLDVVLQIRVGLQTGDVVLDPASVHARTVGGDTFNTAARLQSAATPGTVVVGSGTAALLEGWADLEPLPVLRMKGRSRPEPAFVLTSLLAKRRGRPTAPFVGRARQLEALRGAFRDCVEDQAPVLVTLVGEPGIGKSRLTDQLRAELAEEATVLVGFTPTYGDAAAYAPVIDLLSAATTALDPEGIVAGLRAIVGDRADAVAVVDRLTSLVAAEDASVGGDTAWALRRLLESMAATHPLVAVVEDIHFGGEALLELLDRVVTSVRGPVMVLCTARPELLDQHPTWGGGKARAVTITLGPLPHHDADELARHLLAGADEASLARLTAAAEGNPLYLEQLAALVAEGGADADPETPPSLRALLAARLDRLDPLESRVVDLAAVEGRQFRTEVIALLDPGLDLENVLDALERLEHRTLVTPTGDSGTWQFAHALIQEAASRRTAKADRAGLHVRLADHLARADAPADEVIGAHLERAARLRRELGMADPATSELERRAGERFAAAGARAYASMELTATAELLGRAAALLPLSDPGRAELLPDLGVALMEIGRTDEAERLLLSAVAGGVRLGEVQRARIDIQLLALQGVYRGIAPDEVEQCLVEGRRIVARLDELGDHVALAQGWVLLEYLNWVLGRISPAVDCCVKAVRAAQAAGRVREQWQAGGDLGDYLASGYLPTEQVGRTVDAFAAEPGPVWRLAELAATATAHAFRGDVAAFTGAQAQWAGLAEVHGLEWPWAQQSLAMGQAWIELGDAAAAERAIRFTMDAMERMGDLWSYAAAAWMLPAVVALQGRRDEALALVARTEERDRIVVLDVAARIYDRSVTALGLRLRGRLDEAEVASRAGVDLAAGTELGILHTAALEQLAEILEAAGRRDEAGRVRREALGIHERLGNGAGAARVRGLLV